MHFFPSFSSLAQWHLCGCKRPVNTRSTPASQPPPLRRSKREQTWARGVRKQKRGEQGRVWKEGGAPGGFCTSRDRRHWGSRGLWQQQATPLFMGALKGRLCMCTNVGGRGFNFGPAGSMGAETSCLLPPGVAYAEQRAWYEWPAVTRVN